MPEKLLDLFQGHPSFEKGGRHGVAQQVRIDARGDTGQGGRFLDELLNPPGRIVGMPDRFKQRAGRALPEIGAEFVRQVRQEGDIALPLNLSHFVAHKIWRRRGIFPLRCRAHRLQKRGPLRGLRVPMATISDFLQTAIN